MFRWILIYGVPTLLMLLIWAAFYTRLRAEQRRIAAWPAMIFATMSGIFGLWALTHVMQMAERDPNDYSFEAVAFFLAVLGAISAGVWLRGSRHFGSWGTLAVSLWLACVWGAIVFKL